jgi:hypothetical protein
MLQNVTRMPVFFKSIIDDATQKYPTDVGQVSITWIDNALKVAFDNGDL